MADNETVQAAFESAPCTCWNCCCLHWIDEAMEAEGVAPDDAMTTASALHDDKMMVAEVASARDHGNAESRRRR